MNKTFPVQLDEHLHKRLKIAAIEEGVTLHDLIVRTLEQKAQITDTHRDAPMKRENHDQRTRSR